MTLLTIGIAGGSGAGKTTLARKLFDELGEENVNYLVHDNYYRCLAHLPLEERKKRNFDHPESLETDLLIQHIRELKNGKTVEVPTYDFSSHSRCVETIPMEPRKIILVEGILLFAYPELCTKELMDIKVFVDAEPDVRLMRRLERDTRERGRTVEQVISQYHETVRPMHLEYVEPSKRGADIIVHSNSKHSMEVAIEVLLSHCRMVACLTR